MLGKPSLAKPGARLYIRRDGDGQRDDGPADKCAPALAAAGRASHSLAGGTDRARDRARPALLRRQEPRLLDPPDDRLEWLFLAPIPLRLRQFDGVDLAGPYFVADRDRLLADPAHGLAVPAVDQDAAALDDDPLARRSGPRLHGFF